MTVPRGIRNHNPGNLRRTADPWQGLAAEQTDPEFFAFAGPQWGIRALAVTLITYQDRHGINTVAGIIRRWAPPNENDTRSYIDSVAYKAGVGADEPLNLHDYATLRPIVESIIAHENANYAYPAEVLDAGLKRAGVEPPLKPVTQSKTVGGASVAITGGSIAAAAGTIGAVAPAVPIVKDVAQTVRDYPLELLIILGALAAVGGAVAAWAYLRDRKRGLK